MLLVYLYVLSDFYVLRNTHLLAYLFLYTGTYLTVRAMPGVALTGRGVKVCVKQIIRIEL